MNTFMGHHILQKKDPALVELRSFRSLAMAPIAPTVSALGA